MNKIRIVVVDDHSLVLDGLKSRLQRDGTIEVVGEARNGQQALKVAEQLQPDIVLMDINMPVINGIDALEMFRDRLEHIKPLILSMHDDQEYVLSAITAGAKGYILKSASAEEMIAAVTSVHHGGIFYSPEVAEILLNRQQQRDNTILTTREQTVLSLLAQGMSSKAMARQLNISVRTVETHRRNIKTKLDINNTPDLVLYAIEYGLIKA